MMARIISKVAQLGHRAETFWETARWNYIFFLFFWVNIYNVHTTQHSDDLDL